VIGLDTNVLLRALLDAQEAEGLRARELVAQRCADPESGFVNHVVLCEAAWVLARTYRYSRQQVHEALATILATPAFVIPERDLVEEAMQVFRATRADFADALIGVLNRRSGCATTYTFDRRAAATADFTAVG
jgi:predicted nucleic-acid-binding protein